MHVETHDDEVRLVGADGFMRRIYRVTGRTTIRVRRSWSGNGRLLTMREMLMLRDDVRQALLRLTAAPARKGE